MWPLKKKTPVDQEEEETRKELVALQNADEQMRIVLGLFGQQIKNETLGTNNIPHSTAVYGTYWKEIIPYLKNAISYVQKSKKEDKRIRKIIHKFHLLTNSSKQEHIDHQLKNLLSIHDHIAEEIGSIKKRVEENLKLSNSFSKDPSHKLQGGYDKDSPILIKKFKSQTIYDESNQIWEMTNSLIIRIRSILNMEESLKDVKLSE